MRKTLALLLVGTIGCATADVMRLDRRPRPPKTPAEVELLLEEPERAYTPIAIVQASDQGWGLGLEALKTKMVERAASLGGDAVILGQQSTQSAGMYFMPIGNAAYGMNMAVKEMAGKVIVFTEPATSRRQEPSASEPRLGDAQARTYEGVVNNTSRGLSSRWKIVLRVNGRTAGAEITTVPPLYASGRLTGTVEGGICELSGIVREGFRLVLTGALSESGYKGRYSVEGAGLGGRQEGWFDTSSAEH